MAHVILNNLGPILEAQVRDVLSKIKSAYREGKADHLKLLAFAAELCTLEDIENKLKQKINTADRINKETIDA